MATRRKTGGRQKGTPNRTTAELKAFAGQYGEDAIRGLVSIARSAKTPAAARVAAWREVLDRGIGRPPQALMVTDNDQTPVVTRVIFQEAEI